MGKKNDDKKYTIIGGIVCAIVVVVAIFVNSINKPEETSSDKISLDEAQTKCMLMEETDLVNYSGYSFGDETTKKAQEFCLSLWDRSKNPDNTEESFIEIVMIDWENRKTEVLEGYTLEEYFEEYKNSH